MSIPELAAVALARPDLAGKLPFPVFDPESPDADILSAYEKVRAWRSWIYYQTVVNGAQTSQPVAYDAVEECVDRAAAEVERDVRGDWAETPAGIAAKLMLHLPALDAEIFVDNTLASNGAHALYASATKVNGEAAPVLQAIVELLQFDFDEAVRRYERSVADFELANLLAEALDSVHETAAESPALSVLTALVEQNRERASNQSQLTSLAQTLAPTGSDLLRKASILSHEQWDADPWVLRDIAYIAGRLDGSEKAPGSFDFASVQPVEA
ncbi:MAG: hypothetical protein DI555_13995 [Novosphingobium pentaromativorans]|uniref:Uncharacterized protein n=1 Tax=Novosphingobium pentaromativorans TaxID=205844 RepID=A0A2W5NPZ8_9SPHN|nr:MAG: hypothetical protein DI555_13995 [Novosphingobium pentaromativorans]